jgi:outer membrane protein OmpA-like peptidoglycan-associated protein
MPNADSVNVNVGFEFNSAILRSDARVTLDNLGKALNDPSLAGRTFVIIGHTEAKGRLSYNQPLSQRRAQAVREYLIAHYGIPPSRLMAKGLGSFEPIDREHPMDAINRRIQVITLPAPTLPQ